MQPDMRVWKTWLWDNSGMIYSRLGAAVFVLLLIGVLALVGIGAVSVIGPRLAHGNNVQHMDGFVTKLGPGKDFILKTVNQSVRFQCGNQCRASLDHLQRHLREHAHTDVYYIQSSDNILQAVDVD
jgi:hypothetical protein